MGTFSDLSSLVVFYCDYNSGDSLLLSESKIVLNTKNLLWAADPLSPEIRKPTSSWKSTDWRSQNESSIVTVVVVNG